METNEPLAAARLLLDQLSPDECPPACAGCKNKIAVADLKLKGGPNSIASCKELTDVIIDEL